MKSYIVIAMLLASTMPASARSWSTFKCGQAVVIYGYAKNYDKNDRRYFTHDIEFYNLNGDFMASRLRLPGTAVADSAPCRFLGRGALPPLDLAIHRLADEVEANLAFG
jgi:hypothetical protein